MATCSYEHTGSSTIGGIFRRPLPEQIKRCYRIREGISVVPPTSLRLAGFLPMLPDSPVFIGWSRLIFDIVRRKRGSPIFRLLLVGLRIQPTIPRVRICGSPRSPADLSPTPCCQTTNGSAQHST
ncbi:hypothetical protein A9W97_18810 [Mycobacterium gordonae]|nr:hypothetical protein A9W97_18810 [Mycobacterium gordonae]